MSGTPVKRRKLLKPRSAKYYARKAKIEQALRSLGSSSHTLPALPDSLDIPFSAFSFTRSPQRIDETKISQDQEILAIPTCSSSWVCSATKIEHVLLPRALTKMSEEQMNAKAPLLFNMDIWNKLPAAQRAELEKLLPDFSSMADFVDPQEARQQTLQNLFQGHNFHFGNPIQIFLQRLAHKQFQPQRREAIQREKLLQQFSYVRALKERNFQMIRKMMEMKENLEVSEPRDYLLLPPPPQQTSAAHLARDYEACSDTDGDSEEEQTLAANSQKDIIQKLDAAVQRKGPEDESSVLGKRVREAAEEGGERKTTSSLKSLLFDDSLPPEVVPSGPVWAFFGALRDLFVAHQHSMTLDALEEAYREDEGRLPDISPGYTLRQFLQLGLDFLQNPPPTSVTRQVERKPTKPPAGGQNGAKGEAVNPASMASILNPVSEEDGAHSPATASSGAHEPTDKENYQPGRPFVIKVDADHWQWIGATDEDTIREELDILELLFYYAVTRLQVNESRTQVELVPPKQQKCTSTIRTSTSDELENYRQQERERYLAPEYPYRYRFRGAECVVAPMNRGLGNQSQKPRDHFLLQKDRPPHISLLCLVRDAAARLPGGMGTRPDVAMLLLDSQYVNTDVPEGKLNTVVSGALDRLHSQKDPCVKFDSDQKLWIYLHRRRVEANFEVTKAKKKGR